MRIKVRRIQLLRGWAFHRSRAKKTNPADLTLMCQSSAGSANTINWVWDTLKPLPRVHVAARCSLRHFGSIRCLRLPPAVKNRSTLSRDRNWVFIACQGAFLEATIPYWHEGFWSAALLRAALIFCSSICLSSTLPSC